MRNVNVLGHAVGPWHRAIPLLILAVTVVALSTAFIAEIIFGLEPCVLCLYQRIPYAVAGLVAAVALVVPMGWKPWVLLVCAAIMLSGAALAIYHVGVEQHWWDSITACGGADAVPETLDALRSELQQTEPMRPCDQVEWTLFGLSLAAYNGIGATILAVGCAIGARMVWKETAG